VDSSRTLPADVNGDLLDQLLAANALVTALTHVVGEGVVQLDESHRVVRFSPAAESILGYSTEGIAGRPFAFLLHESNTAQLDAACPQAQRVRLVMRDSAGEPLDVNARALALRRGAATEGWIIAFAPKTRVEEIEQLKTELVSTVSHELKTPLAAIKAYTATLRSNPSLYESHRDEFLGVVEQQADRLSRLVDDMLLVTRVESGQMLRRRITIPLETIVDEALRDVHYDPVAHPVDRRCAGVLVSGDPERLRDVFRNLLENAFKYSPDGGAVAIAAEYSRDATVVRISDHGVGIDEEDLPYIFDRFYRAQSAHSSSAGGSGLGLYIVHALVRAHGGSIEVRSELGAGTTFTVRLPIR
jgi:two-component system phosphate regulon sensor histidine kinase PhoR